MNKEELRHLSSDCEYFLNGNGRGEINLHNFVENLRTTYIEPLEDKITELKLKLEALEGQTPWKDIKDKSEVIGQLTKAKELLRYYFDCFKNDNKYTLSDFEVVEDTEQFLSEVEK